MTPPPKKNKKVIKPHPQKMNHNEQEVCNMAFSYLLFQWEGVVWPVLPKHLKNLLFQQKRLHLHLIAISKLEQLFWRVYSRSEPNLVKMQRSFGATTMRECCRIDKSNLLMPRWFEKNRQFSLIHILFIFSQSSWYDTIQCSSIQRSPTPSLSRINCTILLWLPLEFSAAYKSLLSTHTIDSNSGWVLLSGKIMSSISDEKPSYFS